MSTEISMIEKIREIKFRAWKEKEKEMHEWDDDIGIFNDSDGLFTAFERLQKQGFILMQYVGFKDRKGVEIYEGDLIKNTKEEGWIFEVSWDSEMACFQAKSSQNKGVRIGGVEMGDYLIPLSGENEVIGNIYENPNLLKKEK